MAGVNVKVDMAAIHLEVHKPSGAVASRADDLAECMTARARIHAPVDSGLLRSHIRAEVTETEDSFTATITCDVPYANYVEEGTGIYGPKRRPIVPRNQTRNAKGQFGRKKRYLVFRGETGELVFATSVRGRKATPFMAPAVDECLREAHK